MPVTTVLNEDTATIVSDDPGRIRFSWSAAFAGAFVAVAVTFFLLTLGSGIGLSLASRATNATTFLTLGAIYFLAAQAFGFAAGGHIVGRLIGPAVETGREEDFRAGAHGLVSWALAVVATSAVVGLWVLVGGSAVANGASTGLWGTPTRGQDTTPTATSYWTDKLFRPAASSKRAELTGMQYAQNDTGMATDGTTAPDQTAPTDTTTTAPTGSTPTYFGGPSTQGGPAMQGSMTTTPPTTAAAATTAFRAIGADKAEAGRILTVGMANGATLSSDDRAQLARLVTQDAGLTPVAAQQRVSDVTARMRHDEVTAADAARKAAAYASLWTAFALLFGAIVAIFAAVSARWEDDREAGLFPGTRVSTVRF